jgi:hypothetical protein
MLAWPVVSDLAPHPRPRQRSLCVPVDERWRTFLPGVRFTAEVTYRYEAVADAIAPVQRGKVDEMAVVASTWLDEWFAFCGPRHLPKRSVKPSVERSTDKQNGVICCQKLLWHFAKWLVSEDPADKKGCPPRSFFFLSSYHLCENDRPDAPDAY